MRELVLAGRRVSESTPAYVIAEIGCNHGGDVATACDLVRAAGAAGVDAVKFQKRENATLYSADLLNRPYDHEHSYGPTYGAHRSALELDAVGYHAIATVAGRCGVTWFATAFDERSVDFLMAQGVPALKIHSGGLTDTPLLTAAAQTGVPLLLSTGGGTLADIDRAATLIAQTQPRLQLALLHCTAAYPTDWIDLNLRCIETLLTTFPELVIGWSGHDSGIAMAVAAYTLGARLIEKHFTLNRAMKGTDHAFSLEPAGMKKLCRDLRRAHVALGDGVKRWVEAERAPISKMRRVPTAQGMQITGELADAHD